jgi:hypothetical protein
VQQSPEYSCTVAGDGGDQAYLQVGDGKNEVEVAASQNFEWDDIAVFPKNSAESR